MSSIYIGIPVIHDQEFFHTIENCLAQADNPSDIHFGIYALCENEFWEDYKSNHIDRVKLLETYTGVKLA
jgi:hypothetical protein